MTTWWTRRNKNKAIRNLLRRSGEIEQLQVEQTLELIQLSLMGLIENPNPETSKELATRNAFIEQYDRALNDLGRLAQRIKHSTAPAPTIAEEEADDYAVLTPEEERILNQVESDLAVAAAKPIDIAGIISRTQSVIKNAI